MIVARDTRRDRAVTGIELAANQELNTPSGEAAGACADQYTCLICDSPVDYTAAPATLADYFSHTNRDQDCINTGNVSLVHRLGQEIAAKLLFNWLSTGHQPLELDIEKRIGGQSSFVIADVSVEEPIQLAVEIVYQTSQVSLHRRLQTLFDEGYTVMIVCSTTGRSTPTQIETHLQPIGPIRVGRFNPRTATLKFGSVVTSNQVSLTDKAWASVPAYLS